MPPAAIPIGSRIRAEFAILSLAPPGRPEVPFGIVLIEQETGRFEWRLRTDLNSLGLDAEDIDYASLLDEDFRARVGEMGGPAFLRSLEDSLSGFVRISGREFAAGRSFERLLQKLFDNHVSREIRPFVTHLPRYSLQAAATKFGEDLEVGETEVEWVRAPAGLRLSSDLFVVQVVGRSMEPLIPNGSLAIFRKPAAGSRQGKRLLIEEIGVSGTSARFTVKRYTSVKGGSDEDNWSHSRIRLEPLNREFPAFDLDAEEFAQKYRVVGEFVQVLSEPEG